MPGVELERLPLSASARDWLGGRADLDAALLSLATGGDDYELACAVAPAEFEAFAAAAGMPVTVVGTFAAGEGVTVSHNGKALRAGELGWRHT